MCQNGIENSFYECCSAITIKDFTNYNYSIIPHFIGGDIKRFNSSFESFKRVDFVDMLDSYKKSAKNLKLIDKASVYIDRLGISNEILQKLWKFYKDKVGTLRIDYFDIKLNN